jgi:L-amino acid N-acyltransferase YncA
MIINQISDTQIEEVAKFECEISKISFLEDAIVDVNFHINKIRRAMEKEIDGMYVLEIDNEVIGWLWICIKNNSITNEPYAYLKSIYVKPFYRSKGYAAELLNTAVCFCKNKNVKKIMTKIHYDNMVALSIFKKHGFICVHLTMECDSF